jgi:polysaccharide export outer membrane protein
MLRPVLRILLACLTLCALVAGRPAGAAEADTSAMDWSKVPEYRIVPGDLIQFNFGPRPDAPMDLVRSTRVRPDGRISVFPIGDVVAAGLTPRELERSVVSLLAADLRNPRVVAEVTEFAGNQVHVLGQVKNPQSVPARPFMTVLQAVAAAGGFADDASRDNVLVFHRDGARTVRVARVRLSRAVKSGDLSEDMMVGRFDIVYVPRNAVGSLDVFTRHLFGGPERALNAALIGWELFNLDRVFVVGGTRGSE